jgi:hypothetical protein
MTFTCGTYKFINCCILNYSGSRIIETETTLKWERDTQVLRMLGEITCVLVCGCVLVCSYSTTACLAYCIYSSFPHQAKNSSICFCVILHKNPTNALIYVQTTLFTLLHSCMFHHSKGHPHGVWIHSVSSVNKLHVQISISRSHNILTCKFYWL